MMKLFSICAIAGLVAVAAAEGGWGFYPRPLFRTPQSAVYCYVDGTNHEDRSPQLFCWTPNDGWAVEIGWRNQRATTAYYTKRPAIVHGMGVLKGYRPRARVLGFGRRWAIRCRDTANVGSCGTRGVVAFTCVSRVSGLTCTNAADHGFWIGRFRGYRLF